MHSNTCNRKLAFQHFCRVLNQFSRSITGHFDLATLTMVVTKIAEIFGREMKGKTPEEDDCLECRLVGGTGLAMAGSYVLHSAYYYKDNNPENAAMKFKRTGKVAATAFGILLIGLGLVRFSGRQLPFTSTEQSTSSS